MVEKWYPCKMCEKKYTGRRAVYYHTLTEHAAKLPHTCSTCGKGFPMLSSLKKHLACHTGEKAYECEVCKMRFAHKSVMVVHRKSHLPMSERPFACDQCHLRFIENWRLKKHKLSHEAPKAENQQGNQLNNQANQMGENVHDSMNAVTDSMIKTVANAMITNVDNSHMNNLQPPPHPSDNPHLTNLSIMQY